MAGNSLESGRSVTSKVVAILMTFTDGEVHTLTEVAKIAGIPTSTVHRLIGELAAWGVLERTDGSQYRVGAPLREICSHTSRTPNLQERGRRVLEDISLVAHAPVRLGVLTDSRVSYIEKTAVHRPASGYPQDSTAPIHASAMGKALLAFSPQATFDQVVSKGLKSYTPSTITSVDELAKALASVRLSRFAVSRSEWMPGLSALAVPVFGPGGKVLAAIEVTVRDLRTDLRTLHPVLVVAARGLSREMAVGNGYDRAARLLHRGWGASLSLAPSEPPRAHRAHV